MTEEQIEYSIKEERLKLGFWDKFTHYFVVVFIFLIPLFFIIFFIKDFFQGKQNNFKIEETIALIGLLLVGVLCYKIQRKRLNFKTVKTHLNRNDIASIIDEVAKELEWDMYEVSDKFIIAKTHPSFLSGSYGEQITILFYNDLVLINSICDPNKKSSMISMGRNKKNENKLIEAITKASGFHSQIKNNYYVHIKSFEQDC